MAAEQGDGLARAVTLTTRLILIMMAISILSGLGVPSTPILPSLRDLIPK
jgi:hypothetical protein